MSDINKDKEDLLSLVLIKELLRYEYETGLFYWLVSRQNNKIKAGQIAGWVNKHGYVIIQIDGYQYRAHRLAWFYHYGVFPREKDTPFIDHINGKKGDNRIVNLRTISTAENARNKRMQTKNTSGVTGIYRDASPNNSKKTPKINYYWVASWYNTDFKLQRARFSIQKLGEEGAKQAAIEHRATQLHLLETIHSVKYTARHGKQQ